MPTGVSPLIRIGGGRVTLQRAPGVLLRRAIPTLASLTASEQQIARAALRARSLGPLKPAGIDAALLEFGLLDQRREVENAAFLREPLAWFALPAELRYPSGTTTSQVPSLYDIAADLGAEWMSGSDRQVVLKIFQIGQADRVLEQWKASDPPERKRALLDQLKLLETTYELDAQERSHGIGAFARDVEELLAGGSGLDGEIEPPAVVNVTAASEAEKVKGAKLAAFRELERMYVGVVAGGIAERFGFEGPKGCYPAYPLTRRSLYAGQADNIHAFRNLFYLVNGRVVDVPYVLMLSDKTEAATLRYFAEQHYLGLGQENVRTFRQLEVPVVDQRGKWVMEGPYRILTKPHGHGDWGYGLLRSGIGRELSAQRRYFEFGIQIEDPLCFLRFLELMGLGIAGKHPFGFQVMQRRAGFAEGAVVQVQARSGHRRQIRNIEYTTFQRYEIKDEPDGSGFSPYPGNAAIYFAYLPSLLDRVEVVHFPGAILEPTAKKPARPEAQRQGMAELVWGVAPRDLPFVMAYPRSEFAPFKEGYDPSSFCYLADKSAETARQQVINLQSQWLGEAGVIIPRREHVARDKLGAEMTLTVYDHTVVELTPAFATSPELVRQKVKGGSLSEQSTLLLTGFHGFIQHLDLQGALEIRVENEVGGRDEQGKITPDWRQAGKYKIGRLTVRNQGRTKKLTADGRIAWQGAQFNELETCRIEIQGNGELEIEDGVVLSGNLHLVVPAGKRVVLKLDSAGGYTKEEHDLPAGHSTWHYAAALNTSPQTTDLFQLTVEN